MEKIAVLTKKTGEQLKGYWNGKNYNGIIYFNLSETGKKADINWKKAEKINRTEIKSLVWEEENMVSFPKTTDGWMKEMERQEAIV